MDYGNDLPAWYDAEHLAWYEAYERRRRVCMVLAVLGMALSGAALLLLLLAAHSGASWAH